MDVDTYCTNLSNLHIFAYSQGSNTTQYEFYSNQTWCPQPALSHCPGRDHKAKVAPQWQISHTILDMEMKTVMQGWTSDSIISNLISIYQIHQWCRMSSERDLLHKSIVPHPNCIPCLILEPGRHPKSCNLHSCRCWGLPEIPPISSTSPHWTVQRVRPPWILNFAAWNVGQLTLPRHADKGR